MALAQVVAYTPASVAAAVGTALAPEVAVECKLAAAVGVVVVLVELPLSERLPGRSTLHILGRRRHCLLSRSYSWGRG